MTTSIWFLMGLLLLAYVGSFLLGQRAARGYGLASSAEYVVLGFFLGPHMLGLLNRSLVTAFDPLTNVAVGWLALVIGLDYGFVERRRVPAKSILLSSAVAVFTGGVVAWGVSLVTRDMTRIGPWDRLLLAGGVGAACAETTRHVLRWVIGRRGRPGPIGKLVAEIADADDLVTIVATAILFSLHPPESAPWALHPAIWTLVNLALGVVMGSVATVLLGKEFRLVESWGVLLGTSLLAIGLAAQIGLSPLASMFLMGATIAALSHHRVEVWAMASPTERAVLLPTFVLAGARIDLGATRMLPWIIGIALALRVVAKLASGLALRKVARELSAAPPWGGLGLLSTGGLAMSIGLAFALRFPGQIGDTVLAAAAAATVFGELLGPVSLRRLLRQAGELAADTERPRLFPVSRPESDSPLPDVPSAHPESEENAG